MLKKIQIYLTMLIFLVSCATPKAIDIKQLGDEQMSCNELILAYEKASLASDMAHEEKGATEENILSGLFFFPAYFVTFGTTAHAEYNAASRKEYLLRLYNNKKCAEKRNISHQQKVSETLANLEKIKEQYIRGVITEEDYNLSRKQLLILLD